MMNDILTCGPSAASSVSVDGQNLCLKAAQDCGLYEKCGSLRSEYVVACIKRSGLSDSGCNRQKCHKALRRFLERVPEEYSFALLFCPCSDTLCGERRRKTIVPSCSYEETVRGEERAGKPNCLSLHNYCSKDELCRSISKLYCAKALQELGAHSFLEPFCTIMTPNYVSNSSTEVSQWCTCDGSGNEWQSCQRILNLFTSNICLRKYNKSGCHFVHFDLKISSHLQVLTVLLMLPPSTTPLMLSVVLLYWLFSENVETLMSFLCVLWTRIGSL
uniref:GDNF/GAS1 domain-containing protein n=1 Tax=Neogobius melanostomus TaxID=47308 RepID=A0A8C6T096_9GOBI